MLVNVIKTHKIGPGESLIKILDRYLPKLSEKSIIAITSKIVSISEKNIVPKSKIKHKIDLVRNEADISFPAPIKQPDFQLTLKNKRLVPNAGIDESNCQNCYVLLPQKPELTAQKIWHHLCKKHQLKHLGIIITDSNSTPLRLGVTGITLGWCGFKPIYSYIGQKDIFGSKIKTTRINLLDSLATATTLNMGEGKEQTPIAIIENPPNTVKFQNRVPTKKELQEIHINFENDLFSPTGLYESLPKT